MKNKTNRVIDVDDQPVQDVRPTEVPFISIERDGEIESSRIYKPVSRRRWLWIAIVVILILAVVGVFIVYRPDGDYAVKYYKNLADEPFSPSAHGTVRNTDTILGVTMDMYDLRGLSASLEKEMPDTADCSLILFMRSADYHPDRRAIGPVIVNGEYSDYKPSDHREGYIAISPKGRAIMGIDSGGEIEKAVMDDGGSFFRQMLLLDDGELPRDFQLRGKVERAAIASTVSGDLFYVVTREKETMYDFADALREYGFVDAVYMTGGNAYSFYRDEAGNSHANSATIDKIAKYRSEPLPQPLLVFRGVGK